MKAAAYCRVSTDKEDQLNSLENQKRYFHNYINLNPLWELVQIYADEGITGTSTKKRYAFRRMLKDAQNHSFELVLTKEISRFARNTLDSIYYTRKLKSLGIGVIFLNDNINTMDSDAELRLTIMASIAQEESRKTSERVKWGQKRSMERGVVFGRDMLGYDLRDGRLYVNEAGAKTVRLIFHKFVLEGKGTHVIARELTEAGIPSAGGNNKWHGTVILRILKNEKYCGDLIQKKTYTPDYLNHEKKYNKGEEEFITLFDHHVPIISRELFRKARIELQRRSPSPEARRKYSNRYCFSGLIQCGACGGSYVSRTKKRGDGSVYRYWRCYEAVQRGRKYTDISGHETGCSSRTVAEEDLKSALRDIIINLRLDKRGIINILSRILKKVIFQHEQDEELERLEKRLKFAMSKKQRLIDLYLSKEIADMDYKALKQKYESDIAELSGKYEEEAEKLSGNSNSQSELFHDAYFKNIINTLYELVNGQVWDDAFYRNILDRIIINTKTEIEIKDTIEKADNVKNGNLLNNNIKMEIYLKNLEYKIDYVIRKEP